MRSLLPLLGALLLLCGALLPLVAAQTQADEAQIQESDFQNEFVRFTLVYNRSYADASELSSRYSVFKANVRLIRAHNAAAARGEHTHTLAVNQFADLTAEEFKQQRAAARTLFQKYTRKHRAAEGEQEQQSADPSAASRSLLQSSLDWQTAGKVTSVWNQGNCGCDYAMCTADVVASAAAIAGSRSPVQLSALQLLGCTTGAWGNQGCSNGLPDQVLQYLMSNGVQANSTYPFTSAAAFVGGCYHTPSLDVQAPLSGYAFVSPTEAALQTALQSQPIVIAIEATAVVFQFYNTGVITSTSCGNNLDHSMLLVGYGTDAATGTDYWRIKNSYGPLWGEQGYVRIQKGVGRCGMGDYSVYPII